MESLTWHLNRLFPRRPSVAELRQGNKIVGPDFICFGMQKAGTRWLFDQLNARADVWMPPIKELNFFTMSPLNDGNLKIIYNSKSGVRSLAARSHDELRREIFIKKFATYDKISDLSWYKSLFLIKGDRISGDISPNYGKITAKQISAAATGLPDTRFIFLVREPVDRLWSGASMYVRQKRISAEQITDWATLKPMLSRGGLSTNSYPSRIWTRWSEIIPPERVRFWFFDDIVQQPGKVIDEICNYLSIEPGPGALPANFNRKKSNEKIPMPNDIRERLNDHFAGELDRCAQIFGGHAIRWRDAAMTSGRA